MALIGINNGGKPLINISISNISKILKGLKNIPEWIKIVLYPSICMGFIYFAKFDSGSYTNTSDLEKLRTTVVVLNNKVNSYISVEDYEYDKHQIIFAFNSFESSTKHSKEQFNFLLEILIMHLKKENPRDPMISQLEDLENCNEMFYKNHYEELRSLVEKYKNSMRLDSIASNKKSILFK